MRCRPSTGLVAISVSLGPGIRDSRHRDLDVGASPFDHVAGDHRAEVAPSGPDDLQDVDQEEQAESDRHPEVDQPGTLVAAEQQRERVQLGRLVDGEPADHDDQCHHEHGRVRDALGGVVLALWRHLLLEVQVVEHDVLRLPGGVAVREDVAPLLGCQQVRRIDRAVDHEQPAEGEVERHAAGEAPIELERLVDGVGEEGEPLPAADPEGVDVLRPVDAQPAPDHDHQQREVDPVQPADCPWVHEAGDRFVRRPLLGYDGLGGGVVGGGVDRHASDGRPSSAGGRSIRASVSSPFPDVSRSDTGAGPQR